MKQEIRQNGETILESDDNISIPMIFNNLTGRNSKDNKEYQAYIKYTAIPLMGFQYGRIEFWDDGKLKRTGYITKLLHKKKTTTVFKQHRFLGKNHIFQYWTV